GSTRLAISEVAFAGAVFAGAVPCPSRAGSGANNVGMGRAMSGAIIEKVSAITKRIRFKVTPLSCFGEGCCPPHFACLNFIDGHQRRRRSTTQESKNNLPQRLPVAERTVWLRLF